MLGAALFESLRAAGHEVRALVRPGPRALPEGPGLTWVRGDLDDLRALDALVEGTDAIVHAAYCRMEDPPPEGRSVGEHFIQTNLGGTVRLIERTPATRHNQLVYVSSLAVYGPDAHLQPAAQAQAIDEDFPVWPREFYGAHKAALEKMVIAGSGVGMSTCAFRLGCVLGTYPDTARDPLAIVAREALEHGEIRTRAGAYALTAGDAAALITGALGDAATTGMVYNAFDRWLDFAELAVPLGRILGREVKVACAPAPQPAPPIRNDRVRARIAQWHTSEELPRLLSALEARLRSAG